MISDTRTTWTLQVGTLHCACMPICGSSPAARRCFYNEPTNISNCPRRESVTNHINFTTNGILRFTSPRLLVEVVQRLSCIMHFHDRELPLKSFELIDTNSFEIGLPSDLPSIPDNLRAFVDSILTHSFCCECIAPSEHDSMRCA